MSLTSRLDGHAPLTGHLNMFQSGNQAEGGNGTLTASHMLGVTPSAEYSWRAPSPPHIHIPQAHDNKPLALQPYHDFHCKPQHREALIHITQGTSHSIIPKDWKYDWRRSAQPMVRFLFLGPSSAARDIEALKKEGISMLLVIRDTMMAQARFLSGEKVASQLGIEADAIDVAGNMQLIAAFPKAVERINDHLVSVFEHRVRNCMSPNDPAACGKVLLFCESGNERSATVAAAYLIHMYNLDEIAAVQYVQAQRFCVAFDDALKHLLRSYREILQARTFVNAASVQAPSSRSASKSKRGRDEMDDDEDMDFDAEHMDDVERFGKRSAFTPFRDLTNQ